MATRPPRRGFTTETQLRRHQSFIENVFKARRPKLAARRGRYQQVRALLGAVCSVLFADIPPDEETRARVQRSPCRRALKELTRETVYQLLATRDLEKYFHFLDTISSLIKPLLSNIFTSCVSGGEAISSSSSSEILALPPAPPPADEEATAETELEPPQTEPPAETETEIDAAAAAA